MRQTARLLEVAKSLDSSITDLKSAIKPYNFDIITSAVKQVAGYDDKTHHYKVGRLPLKLGHNLKKCAAIINGMASRLHDCKEARALETDAKKFLELMEDEWAETISSQALTTLEERRFNKPDSLPLVSDIQRLNLHVNQSIALEMEAVRGGDMSAHVKLSKLTLASVILFNRKSSGEAQRITIDNCHQGSLATMNDDITNSLSPVEKTIISKLTRIEIRGKRGKRVPVLLRKSHINAIDLLLETRDQTQIPETNIYLFPRENHGSNSPLDACEVLRSITAEAKLEQPSLVRSTKLRKHVATISQFLNLNDIELKQLCTLMGHNFSVHLNFYRLPTDVAQIPKVGKFFLQLKKEGH